MVQGRGLPGHYGDLLLGTLVFPEVTLVHGISILHDEDHSGLLCRETKRWSRTSCQHPGRPRAHGPHARSCGRGANTRGQWQGQWRQELWNWRARRPHMPQLQPRWSRLRSRAL